MIDNIHVRKIENGFIVSWYTPAIVAAPGPVSPSIDHQTYCPDLDSLQAKLADLLHAPFAD